MEGYSSIEPSVFTMSVLDSTTRPNNVKKLVLTVLKCILTPLFVTVDIFALVVPYLFSVWFVLENYDRLGQKIASMVTFIPIRIYKSHDMS